MIFADTSFWIALHQRRDNRHGQALALAERYRDRLVATSNMVVGEAWTMLRRRAGHVAAIAWLGLIRSNEGIRIERVEPDLEDEAWSWLHTHDERPYSFVDATSFALMRRLRMREALAFDGDFSAAGFVELRP
jgi:predicted nucleic acid-binding protein